MHPVLLAGCAIFQGESLLVLKRRKTGWYEMPGGKVNPSETPERAAIREVREELGCDVVLQKKMGQASFLENGKTYHYTWFLARIAKGQKPFMAETESFEHALFVPVDTLRQSRLSPNLQNFLAGLK